MQQCDLVKVRPAAFVQTFFLSRILQSCNPSVKKLFYGTRAWVFHQQWYLIRVKGHPALRTCVPAESDTIIFSCRVKYLTAIILHRVFMCAIPNKKKLLPNMWFYIPCELSLWAKVEFKSWLFLIVVSLWRQPKMGPVYFLDRLCLIRPNRNRPVSRAADEHVSRRCARVSEIIWVFVGAAEEQRASWW